jgi:glycosyltransferase involved in cell wall biosynthesis
MELWPCGYRAQCASPGCRNLARVILRRVTPGGAPDGQDQREPKRSVAVRRKSFVLKTRLDPCVCKPNNIGANLNQDSKSTFWINMQSLRIAQVAPVAESVPPKYYGGVERIVSYLTEELVRQGHEVTLFASGDSITKARLVPIRSRALRLDTPADSYIPYHKEAVRRVISSAREFDVIHFHMEPFQFQYARHSPTPILTTLHGRLDLEQDRKHFSAYSDLPMVSISDAQRAPLPNLNWQATIHHGLPIDLYKPSQDQRTYLAFLGRISPEKRPDRAIEIAERSHCKLKIAAKIDPSDELYFNKHIKDLLDKPFVEFIGEISDADKGVFLSRAKALLFPGDWPEPFGITLIEALACGTPVIALRHGAVSEIIEDGSTGFIVDSLDEAVQAVHKLDHLNHAWIRKAFEARFSVERMTQEYLTIYRSFAGTD